MYVGSILKKGNIYQGVKNGVGGVYGGHIDVLYALPRSFNFERKNVQITPPSQNQSMNAVKIIPLIPERAIV